MHDDHPGQAVLSDGAASCPADLGEDDLGDGACPSGRLTAEAERQRRRPATRSRPNRRFTIVAKSGGRRKRSRAPSKA